MANYQLAKNSIVTIDCFIADYERAWNHKPDNVILGIDVFEAIRHYDGYRYTQWTDKVNCYYNSINIIVVTRYPKLVAVGSDIEI